MSTPPLPARSRLSGCGLQSSLPDELSRLASLRSLDLSANQLSGGVPSGWTVVGAFPALETLQLADNRLAGALDDWTVPAGFICSKSFNISGNAFSAGPIPGGWYSRTLAALDIAYNNVSGPLPLEWGLAKPNHEDVYPSAFPALALLYIMGNNLSGGWPSRLLVQSCI